VNAGSFPEDEGRGPEHDNGATVDRGKASVKPGSFQKNHDNLQRLHLFVLKSFTISLLSFLA
jgi:hypothetical protein